MMDKFERFVEEIENEPEIVSVKEKMRSIETMIRESVDDSTWGMLLEWESQWASYVEFCIKRLMLNHIADVD